MSKTGWIFLVVSGLAFLGTVLSGQWVGAAGWVCAAYLYYTNQDKNPEDAY